MASDNRGYKNSEEISDTDVVITTEFKHDENEEIRKKLNLLYSVEDVPPVYLSVLLGLQHILTASGALISVPLIIAPALCVTDDVVKAELLNTLIFVSGLATFFQSTIGTRLPILQGGTFSFLTPTFAILALPQFRCPETIGMTSSGNLTLSGGTTAALPDLLNATVATPQEETTSRDDWKIRILEVQGAIIGASLFEVVIGAFGLVGLMLQFIGPLVIAPTIALIGISLFGAAANYSAGNWWVAIMTIVLILLFSQYLRNVNIPCCCYSRDKKQCGVAYSYPFFKLFPIIMAILISWFVCAIMTWTNAFPDNPNHFAYGGRTDGRSNVLSRAKWFRFPYPFQWGIPTFSVASVFGMLSGVLAGIIESIGDYYACARASGAPPPPLHAINRGIFIEGIGCVFSGMWGSGNATTSYSENIGAISITKVGSRRVIQTAGIIMLILGLIGKFGAFFVTIPDPVIGGVFMVMFGMIAAVGISNLQYVDMNSSRNLCIFGFSLVFGLALPQWMSNNQDAIGTGSQVVDQILTVLLSTSMFVGGAVAFILDNTVPGTIEERGLHAWNLPGSAGDGDSKSDQCYDFPYGMSVIRRQKWFSYIPVCPTFRGYSSRRKRKESVTNSMTEYDKHVQVDMSPSQTKL